MRQMQDQIEVGMAGQSVEAVVIFAIDNGSDPRVRARFERHLDTLRAMGSLKRPVRLCIGMWKGQMEASYEMLRSDFEAHVMQGGWITNQEAILGVVAGQAVLIDQQGNVSEAGYWTCVDVWDANRSEGFTYYLDTNQYYTAI